jgi:hypothetical protein
MILSETGRDGTMTWRDEPLPIGIGADGYLSPPIDRLRDRSVGLRGDGIDDERLIPTMGMGLS